MCVIVVPNLISQKKCHAVWVQGIPCRILSHSPKMNVLLATVKNLMSTETINLKKTDII